jgi:hypothetical protein
VDVLELAQVCIGSGGVVSTPELDVVRLFSGNHVESLKSGLENLSLGLDQTQRRQTRSTQQDQLELELDPHVSNVSDRGLQPAAQVRLSNGRDLMNDPLRTIGAGFDMKRSG